MSRDINLLHPTVKQQALLLRELAKSRLGLNIIFTNTLRTGDEQAALYAQGRRPLTITNSFRKIAGLYPIDEAENKKIVTNANNVTNSFHGYGLAFDIAVTNESGKQIKWEGSDWNNNDISDWDEVGKLADDIGLEWGGNWSGLRDAPHFQNRLGFTLAQLKSGTVKV